MKYNVISYLIGEGFRNVFKNKKSTAASIGIMCASMIVFGLFFLIGENVNHIMENVQEAQGIEVFILEDATQAQIDELGVKIKELDEVSTMKFVSKEEAVNRMKERWKDRAFLLEGYEEVLPPSYIITLSNLEYSEQVQEKINTFENVKEITSADKTITALIGIANGIKTVTGCILVILILISLFIISNTIKLTVHARRREISIMKYVGATNGFIRWPFIVEGIIIGLISGFISIAIVSFGYNLASQAILESSIVKDIQTFTLLGFSDIFSLLLSVYIILGAGIGVIGSSISMRKYLEV